MRRSVVLVLFVGLVAAACGGSAGGIEVTDVWGRPSPSAATNAAFYMHITNSGDTPDRLVGASSPACTVTEFHEMYMKDGGVMGMRPVEGGAVDLAPGETVEFKPGGLHVMCIGITEELQPGATVPLTLTFEHAGERRLEVEIRAN